MNLVANEQAKLTATYVNGVAIAVVAIGGIGPWVAFAIQTSGPSLLSVVASSVLCICTSVGLRLGARKVLMRLREA